MITQTTKYGNTYESPIGLSEDEYYNLLYTFVELAKVKGLTVKQAQKMFADCSDLVLYTKL